MKTKVGRILHFGCESKGVEISTGGRKLGTAGNLKQMQKLVNKIKLTDADVCMFSSSMDFPEEYTSNKSVLALVKKLRG